MSSEFRGETGRPNTLRDEIGVVGNLRGPNQAEDRDEREDESPEYGRDTEFHIVADSDRVCHWSAARVVAGAERSIPSTRDEAQDRSSWIEAKREFST